MTGRRNSQERGCVCRPRHNRADSDATALRPDGFLMLVQISAIFETKPGTSWSDLCRDRYERHRMAREGLGLVTLDVLKDGLAYSRPESPGIQVKGLSAAWGRSPEVHHPCCDVGRDDPHIAERGKGVLDRVL